MQAEVEEGGAHVAAQEEEVFIQAEGRDLRELLGKGGVEGVEEGEEELGGKGKEDTGEHGGEALLGKGGRGVEDACSGGSVWGFLGGGGGWRRGGTDRKRGLSRFLAVRGL